MGDLGLDYDEETPKARRCLTKFALRSEKSHKAAPISYLASFKSNIGDIRVKILFWQETIGTALYLGPSILDHSCSPNAAVSFDGVNIVVRSLTDRDELDFGATFIREFPSIRTILLVKGLDHDEKTIEANKCLIKFALRSEKKSHLTHNLKSVL